MKYYSRRHFIKTTAAGAGAMLFHDHSFGATPVSAYHDPYELVELGKTGIKTTRLCMGTGMRGGGRQSNIARLGYEQGVKHFRELYQRGIRMFDLADLYGTHAMASDALKIYPRKDYAFFTKVWFLRGGIPELERPDAETVVARFLCELQTDYIDGVQLHCVMSGNWPSELSDYMTSLNKLKQKGVIRSHGISCHSLAAVETAVGESWVDTLHVRLNAYGNKMDDSVEKVEPVVKRLHQSGKSVIAMKVLGEGEFANNDEKKDNSLRYVLQLGAVDVLNIGIDKISDAIDCENRIRKVPCKSYS